MLARRSMPSVLRRGRMLLCGLAALVPVAAMAQLDVSLTPPIPPLAQQIHAQADATLGQYVEQGRSSFGLAIFVEDGKVPFAHAYGDESPAPNRPLSIDASLVDLNSIEKVFIAVAIAQLVDRGVIASIDDPINRYLKDYQLPLAFGHQVSIRQIATHSAGFDETAFGAGSLQADPVAFFTQRFPGYYDNSGSFSAYSSYGPLLLSYLVSQLTGKPYAEYLTEDVLRPLGMNNTYIADPGHALAHRVLAFQPKARNHTAALDPLMPMKAALPDGQMIATARDMGVFMRALLGAGEPQTVITPSMRTLLFTLHQSNGEWGSAHGLLFDELKAGTARIFNHGGKPDSGIGENCLLALDPERTAGLFYCYADVHDRLDRDRARFPPDYEQIKSEMLLPFNPCRNSALANCPRYTTATTWNEDWNQYLGLYVSFARHHQGPARLRSLLHPTSITVERAGQALRIDGLDGYVEIAPGAFGNPETLETFSFVKDPVTGLSVLSGSGRPSAYERPGLREDPRILPRVLALLVLLALSGGLVVLLPRYGLDGRVRLAVGAYLLVVAGGLGALFGLHAFGRPYFNGVSWPLTSLRVCAFLSIPSCVALVQTCVRINRIPHAGIAKLGQVHVNLLSISSILMVLSLAIVQLIGFA